MDALLMVIAFQRHDLLDTIMKSRTMLGIFRAMSLYSRNEFIKRLLYEFFPIIKRHGFEPLCEQVFRHNMVAVIDYQSSALRYYAAEAV
jgi:hypothetical protein